MDFGGNSYKIIGLEGTPFTVYSDSEEVRGIALHSEPRKFRWQAPDSMLEFDTIEDLLASHKERDICLVPDPELVAELPVLGEYKCTKCDKWHTIITEGMAVTLGISFLTDELSLLKTDAIFSRIMRGGSGSDPMSSMIDIIRQM